MHNTRSIVVLGVFVWCLFIVGFSISEAQACPLLYFDAAGGTSTWDYTTPNWADTLNGPYDQTWIDGYGAYFLGTAGTVNIANTIDSVSALWLYDGYTLNSGTFCLTSSTSSIFTFGNARINSMISGTGTLYKDYSGTLTLGGANTYTGMTRVDEGTLLLDNTHALQNSTFQGGSGNLSFGTLTAATFGGLNSGGSLYLINDLSEPVTLSVGNNNRSTCFGGSLYGPGSLVKVGTGMLTLYSNSSFDGDVVLQSGTLMLGYENVLQNSTLDAQGGALMIASNPLPYATLGGLKGSGDLNIDADYVNVGNNNQSTVYSGVLSGTTALGKVGSGTLTLGGANTLTGQTWIDGGMLRLDNEYALQNSTFQGGSGNLSFGTLTAATFGGLNSGGSLYLINDLSEPVTLSVGNNNQPTFYYGTILGPGTLVKVGSGRLALYGTNDFDGITIIQSGKLEFGATSNWPVLSGAGADVQGGTLTLDYMVGSTSLASDVRNALATGQIFCSTAAANGALGWIDDTSAGKVSIMYTLSGDANLDHSVNGTDLNAVLSNYNLSNAA